MRTLNNITFSVQESEVYPTKFTFHVQESEVYPTKFTFHVLNQRFFQLNLNFIFSMGDISD